MQTYRFGKLLPTFKAFAPSKPIKGPLKIDP